MEFSPSRWLSMLFEVFGKNKLSKFIFRHLFLFFFYNNEFYDSKKQCTRKESVSTDCRFLYFFSNTIVTFISWETCRNPKNHMLAKGYASAFSLEWPSSPKHLWPNTCYWSRSHSAPSDRVIVLVKEQVFQSRLFASLHSGQDGRTRNSPRF